MRTIKEIDNEIRKLEEKLEQVEGRPTEVYTRIVGYYRSLRNWNRGKREEYSDRVLFDPALDAVPAAAPSAVPAVQDTANTTGNEGVQAERYLYFFRETCPNCPPVRSLLKNLDMQGDEMDVDTEEGTRAALEYGIYTTPTVIFFNPGKDEVYRASTIAELAEPKIPQLA